MEHRKNSYKLPLDAKYITHWHKLASPAHVGKLKHSIDFFASVGTPIKAAFDGVVVWLKDDSNIGGISKKYENFGNRLVIQHANNEYSAYEHNQYKSAKVKVGQKVKRGQYIVRVGMTGWAGTTSHLHFEVFINPDKDPSQGTTIKANFDIPKKGQCDDTCYY